MTRTEMNRERWLLGLCLVAVLCLPAGSATAAAKLTAAVGTTSGDQALDARAGLGDGEDLETGDDGGCSLLVDDGALMEVCGNTSLQLERKGGAPDGTRVVKLDQGEIRMVVEPRLGEEKIEIHTPAAIATVLGTILHVAVDANGVTTVTSEVSRVLIESAEPGVTGQTTIDGGQQLVIQPGQAPPARPQQLSERVIGNLGGCLLDFRATALRADRATANAAEIEATVAEDIAVASLPQVAAQLILEPQVEATVDLLPDPAEQQPFPTQAPERELGPGPGTVIVVVPPPDTDQRFPDISGGISDGGVDTGSSFPGSESNSPPGPGTVIVVVPPPGSSFPGSESNSPPPDTGGGISVSVEVPTTGSFPGAP